MRSAHEVWALGQAVDAELIAEAGEVERDGGDGGDGST
jgi:hypothetical protein